MTPCFPRPRGGRFAAIVALIMAVVIVRAGATPPLVDEMTTREWTISDGLPQGTVGSMARTPDGALWLATFGGLVRFDGASFRVLDIGTDPTLPSNRLTSVLVDASGRLWVGSERGELILVDPDRCAVERHWRVNPEDVVIVQMADDGAGRLFAATSAGLYSFNPHEDADPVHDERVPITPLQSVAVAGDGSVWTSPFSDVIVYRLSGPTDVEMIDTSAHEDRGDGRHDLIGLAANQDFAVVASDRDVVAYDRRGVARSLGRSAASLGPAHGVRLAPNGDLVVCHKNAVRYILGLRDWWAGHGTLDETVIPVPGEYATSVLLVDETIWVGRAGHGLLRFRPATVHRFVLDPDLDGRASGSIEAREDGGMLYCGNDFVAVIDDDGATRRLTSTMPFQAIRRAPDGALLVVSTHTVSRCDGTRFEPIVTEYTVMMRDIAWGRNGTIWLATAQGIATIEAGTVVLRPHPDGSHAAVNTLGVDDDGNLWAGGRDVLYRETGPNPRAFRLEADRRFGTVRTIVPRPGGGGVWAGTYGGGLLIAGEHDLQHRTMHDGLPENVISAIVQDAGHDAVWLLGNRGIYRMSLTEFVDACARGGHMPRARAYFSDDGMQEGNGGNPAADVYPDGSLVLSTIAGPRLIHADEAGPPRPGVPVVDSVRIDGVVIPTPADTIDVAADARRIEFEFSAVNLVAPESTYYACRLAGYETEWRVGPSRSIDFTGLPPGTYALQVRASIGDGEWVDARHELVVHRRPAWHERASFRAAAVLGLIAIILLGGFVMRRHHRTRLGHMLEMLELREAARDRERRLVDELNHRVRNNLASVLALLDLGRRSGDDASAALVGSRSRIEAMARVHAVLSRRKWTPVRLSEIIDGVVRAVQPERRGAFVVRGDDPEVPIDQCQPLALLLHELAANAREHGAWLGETGRVTLSVSNDPPGDACHLRWAESDGPAASTPDQLGTGLTLVLAFVEHDLGGGASLSFESTGFRADIRLPTNSRIGTP